MVTLNFDKKPPYERRGFTIAVTAADADDYIATLRALIRMLSAVDLERIGNDDLYLVLNLLEEMLPSAERLKL
ncbi:MAG: hypothetical protein LBG19_13365 [Prevotellaceae bacterium]|jgi:hypothetical protein|nr:hypothetical protein [Prevotellaceae bacterium]